MSNWTHVAGVIRVDDMRVSWVKPLDFESLIGKEIQLGYPMEVFEDAEKHPEKYLPMGSEGSLQMTVWENPDKNSIDAYTITIFGDLRDHDNPQEIVEWFKNVCGKFTVRNATIIAENEEFGIANWCSGYTL